MRLVFSLVLATFFFGNVQLTLAATPAECSNISTTEQAQKCGEATARVSGGCTEDPFPFLFSKYRPGAQSSREGKNGIYKLNPDFACRLSKYLKAYPSVCIISAYRSVETQTTLWNNALKKYGNPTAARKWVAPPGNSKHNKGLAADLCNMTSSIRANAGKYGLVFRLAHEGWHVEPSGSVQGGGGAFDNGDTDSMGNFGASASPSANLSDQIRQMLGLPPQGGAAPAGGGGSGGGYPPPPPPQPIEPVTYNPPIGSELKPLDDSFSGTSEKEKTIGGSAADDLGSFDDESDTSDESSVADKLREIVGEDERSIEDIFRGASGTPSLVVNENDTTKIQPQTPPIPPQNPDSPFVVGTGSGISPSQTFVSNDLSGQSPSLGGSQSLLAISLTNIQTALAELLRVLTPFALRMGEHSEGTE